MNDNIDKDEIRRAIDRLQIEHPCGIAYDPTAFVSMEAVNTIKECVDKIARRMMEDTEINIICEFAKLYLEGARPTILPKREWIPFSERLPEDGKLVLVTLNPISLKDAEHPVIITKYTTEKDSWIHTIPDAVLAWMPLPEPYKEGEK